MTGDVLDVVGPLLVIEDLLPERTRLDEVSLGDGREIADRRAGEELVVVRELVGVLLVGERLDRRRVVGTGALVVERHGAIALEVGDGVDRRVDRELSVVCAETVTAKGSGRCQYQ